MKTGIRIVGTLLLCIATGTQAANCRSATAAVQGSQTAYERDVQAAQETAQKDRSSSDILGKCVGGVTAIITMPQFPSLSQIYDQIKAQICRIASEQVNGALNDVTGQINGALGGITSQIPTYGIGPIPIVPPITPPVIHPTAQGGNTNSAQSPAFWSNIWR